VRRVPRAGGVVEIHWVGLGDLDEAERVEIEARLELLAEGHDDLIDLRITGHKSGHHHHGGQEVRITCQARGREIVAARTRPDLGLALNEALDAFEREVHRLRRKRRDLSRTQPPEPPFLGIVDRIFREEGFGFILTDDGEQVYFQRGAGSGRASGHDRRRPPASRGVIPSGWRDEAFSLAVPFIASRFCLGAPDQPWPRFRWHETCSLLGQRQR
jgi:ribosome-associated translation inhibitor RaiA